MWEFALLSTKAIKIPLGWRKFTWCGLTEFLMAAAPPAENSRRHFCNCCNQYIRFSAVPADTTYSPILVLQQNKDYWTLYKELLRRPMFFNFLIKVPQNTFKHVRNFVHNENQTHFYIVWKSVKKSSFYNFSTFIFNFTQLFVYIYGSKMSCLFTSMVPKSAVCLHFSTKVSCLFTKIPKSAVCLHFNSNICNLFTL